jgi:hypothetical protein
MKMMKTIKKPLTPIDPSRLKPVLKKIAKLTSKDLAKHNVWNSLANLSTKTTLSGIEAHPSGVYRTGKNEFEAVATVYLTLNHGNAKSFANSFPAHVFGTIGTGNSVKIDGIKIDTSSLE